jgi:hypothetical protein
MDAAPEAVVKRPDCTKKLSAYTEQAKPFSGKADPATGGDFYALARTW